MSIITRPNLSNAFNLIREKLDDNAKHPFNFEYDNDIVNVIKRFESQLNQTEKLKGFTAIEEIKHHDTKRESILRITLSQVGELWSLGVAAFEPKSAYNCPLFHLWNEIII